MVESSGGQGPNSSAKRRAVKIFNPVIYTVKSDSSVETIVGDPGCEFSTVDKKNCKKIFNTMKSIFQVSLYWCKPNDPLGIPQLD